MLSKHKNGFKIIFYYVTNKAANGLILKQKWLAHRWITGRNSR